MPQTTKLIPSKQLLLNWLEIDFLDRFLADHHCLNVDEECGMSTKCIVIGSVILRHFYNSSCSSFTSCKFNPSYENSFSGIYERRSMKGNYASYFVENEWHILSDESFYAYDELHSFVGKINASSAASIEFLLFNPIFSSFISTSILFEATKAGSIAMTYEIFPFSISTSNRLYYFKAFFNSVFFLCILLCCKNQLWKMLKHRSKYWRQGSNYFVCLFILVYLIYLVSFITYIVMHKTISSRLVNTQLSSNVNIVDITVCEICVHLSSGLLVFLHLLQCFKVLCFNHRLRKMLKRLFHLRTEILYVSFIFLAVIVVSYVLIKHFIGKRSSFSHPLFGFIKGIYSLFKDYGKPEVNDEDSVYSNIFSIFTSLMLIFVHIYFFSTIRSILLNSDYRDMGLKNKAISLKETRQMFRKKFMPHLHLGLPQITSHEDYVPPVDFLLFELERLADALVVKAENLFPEKCEKLSDIKSFLKSEGEFQLHKASKLKLCEVDYFNNAFKTSDLDMDDLQSHERLISTVPRPNKMKQNTFLPSSFHASLKSERKFRTLESPPSLQQNRIRKTYPLYHLDSDSSISNAIFEQNCSLDSNNSLLIRRTKSRGKFKTDNFYLSLESVHNELN